MLLSQVRKFILLLKQRSCPLNDAIVAPDKGLGLRKQDESD